MLWNQSSVKVFCLTCVLLVSEDVFGNLNITNTLNNGSCSIIGKLFCISSLQTFPSKHLSSFPQSFYLTFITLSTSLTMCPSLQSPRGPAASGRLLFKPDESDQDSVPGVLLQPPVSRLHPHWPQVSPCTQHSVDSHTLCILYVLYLKNGFYLPGAWC